MPTLNRNNSNSERGSALLAVLWLSAALAAISFAVASNVRVETERASTLSETVRAGYLASGAVESAILRLQSTHVRSQPAPGQFRYSFATGEAVAEVIPETSKLDLNSGKAPDFINLLVALGAPPDRATQITAGIMGRRGGGSGGFGGAGSSFSSSAASFQEIEEVLWIPGMTPDLFHGNYTRDARTGQLVRLGAFKDCVSVRGSAQRFNVNGIEPALLHSLGVPWPQVNAFVAQRAAAPFVNAADLGRAASTAGGAIARLSVEANTIFTVRATARLRLQDGRLSDVSRTVAATVKFRLPEMQPAYHILRWDDQAFSAAFSEARAWK
jgi:general secretion pathway protein K